MGNNVMLYLDDIQHTTSSSCRNSSPCATATRRIRRVGQAESQATTCVASALPW